MNEIMNERTNEQTNEHTLPIIFFQINTKQAKSVTDARADGVLVLGSE